MKFFQEEALVAVVDGVGHGEEAAVAARLTANIMQSYSGRHSLTGLFEECHEKLRGSRGAVVSLASLNASDSTMTWLGVGNVEGLLLRKPFNGDAPFLRVQESLLLRAGVVGHLLPHLSASTVPLNCGDVLVFATDGIRPGFADRIYRSESTARIAHRIVNHFAYEKDDALVLVVRYLYGQDSTNSR